MTKDHRTCQIDLREEFAPALRADHQEAVPTVVVHDGDEIGALHGLTKGRTVIGRGADCDIVLVDDQVSRQHAIIRRRENGEFELIDLGSTNGTYLGDQRIDRATLEDGDKIRIADSTLKFSMLDQQDLKYQSRIVEMIHFDDLTGLLTKRSLYRGLEREMIRAARYEHSIAVLMMDLDHFKKVNDTHGHLVGSHCLAEVGRLIRETTRSTDANGRYGGEEFVSFLPETDGEQGFRLAERIRLSLASRKLHHAGTSYDVRISIGVSAFPEDGSTVDALVQAADLALYRAKHRGRNRCERFEPELVRSS